MMWKLFQLSVMAAVMCGNIYYEWTPNPYLVGILGIGAAFIATWLLTALFGRRRSKLVDEATSHHKRTVGARWDPDNLAESIARIRASDDARKLVEIPPEAPSLERIIREAHPLSRAKPLGGKLLKPPTRH